MAPKVNDGSEQPKQTGGKPSCDMGENKAGGSSSMPPMPKIDHNKVEHERRSNVVLRERAADAAERRQREDADRRSQFNDEAKRSRRWGGGDGSEAWGSYSDWGSRSGPWTDGHGGEQRGDRGAPERQSFFTQFQVKAMDPKVVCYARKGSEWIENVVNHMPEDEVTFHVEFPWVWQRRTDRYTKVYSALSPDGERGAPVKRCDACGGWNHVKAQCGAVRDGLFLEDTCFSLPYGRLSESFSFDQLRTKNTRLFTEMEHVEVKNFRRGDFIDQVTIKTEYRQRRHLVGDPRSGSSSAGGPSASTDVVMGDSGTGSEDKLERADWATLREFLRRVMDKDAGGLSQLEVIRRAKQLVRTGTRVLDFGEVRSELRLGVEIAEDDDGEFVRVKMEASQTLEARVSKETIKKTGLTAVARQLAMQWKEQTGDFTEQFELEVRKALEGSPMALVKPPELKIEVNEDMLVRPDLAAAATRVSLERVEAQVKSVEEAARERAEGNTGLAERLSGMRLADEGNDEPTSPAECKAGESGGTKMEVDQDAVSTAAPSTGAGGLLSLGGSKTTVASMQAEDELAGSFATALTLPKRVRKEALPVVPHLTDMAAEWRKCAAFYLSTGAPVIFSDTKLPKGVVTQGKKTAYEREYPRWPVSKGIKDKAENVIPPVPEFLLTREATVDYVKVRNEEGKRVTVIDYFNIGDRLPVPPEVRRALKPSMTFSEVEAIGPVIFVTSPYPDVETGEVKLSKSERLRQFRGCLFPEAVVLENAVIDGSLVTTAKAYLRCTVCGRTIVPFCKVESHAPEVIEQIDWPALVTDADYEGDASFDEYGARQDQGHLAAQSHCFMWWSYGAKHSAIMGVVDAVSQRHMTKWWDTCPFGSVIDKMFWPSASPEACAFPTRESVKRYLGDVENLLLATGEIIRRRQFAVKINGSYLKVLPSEVKNLHLGAVFFSMTNMTVANYDQAGTGLKYVRWNGLFESDEDYMTAAFGRVPSKDEPNPEFCKKARKKDDNVFETLLPPTDKKKSWYAVVEVEPKEETTLIRQVGTKVILICLQQIVDPLRTPLGTIYEAWVMPQSRIVPSETVLEALQRRMEAMGIAN